jgi:hypothetical protein
MKLLIGISVSYRLGPVEGTFMQAYAFQGPLIGLPGLGVCSNFLIENRNINIMSDTSYYAACTSSKERSDVSEVKIRFRGEISFGLYDR